MDILGGQRWILGGGRKPGGGWTGDLISESSFIVAREQSITVNEKARIDLQMKVSIDNRPVPMGVFIDLITDSTFYGISRPKSSCSFWTDWGDDGATFTNSPQDRGRNNANKTYGCETAHLYAAPGTYTAVSYCKDWISGKIGLAVHTFTVTADADTVYAGTKTIHVDPSGVFEDSPVGCQQVTTWADVRAALDEARSGTRVLLAKGQDILLDGFAGFYDFCQIGVIGTGSRPRLIVPNSGIPSLISSVFYNDSKRGTGQGTVFWGFDIVGNYDPVEKTGENYLTDGVTMVGSQKVTFWDLDISGIGTPFYPRHDSVDAENVLLIDCKITNWHNFGVFGDISHSAIIGCDIQQNPLATSGPDARGEIKGSIVSDGVTLTYTLGNLAIFGDVSNAVIYDFDPAADTYTRLALDTDFTFIEGVDPTGINAGDGTHQIALTAAIDEFNELFYHTKYGADHGPIRLERCSGVNVTYNKLTSETGWSVWESPESDVMAVQPCIRWGTNGEAGDWGIIAYNNLHGGATILTTSPANTGIEQFPTDVLLIEQNDFKATDSTATCVGILKTNVVVRNNRAIQENTPSISAIQPFKAFALISRQSKTDSAVDLNPIDVYNNTVVNLRTVENGGIDIEAVFEAETTFPIVRKGNNLVYNPFNVAPLPDYEPLDDDYRPEEGSSALDTGTPTDLVWDDFSGKLVGETASIGAYDTPAPALYTQAEFTRSPATAAQTSTFTIPADSDWKLTHSFIIPNSFSTVSGVIALVGETAGALTRIVFDSDLNPNGPNRLYLGGVFTVMAYDSVIVNDGEVHTLEIEYVDSTGLLYVTVDGVPSGSVAPETSQQLDGNFAITVNNYRATLADAFNATLYCNHIALYTEMEIDGVVEMAFDYSSGALDGETETASTGTGTLLMYGDPIWS